MDCDDFIQRLHKSGLSVTAEHVQDSDAYVGRPVEEITRDLIRDCQLTQYQADVLLGGSTQPLRFGEYTILNQIGRGGMGVVFKARKDGAPELVALKVLPAQLTNNSQAVRRFAREAEFATQLEHPNLVRAIDFGAVDGRHFLAMEYVDGGNLADSIREKGVGLPLLTTFEYLRDAARGLEFAHGQKVIHRDIKPSNMLVHRNGTLKILDMGLARAVLEEEANGVSTDASELTATGTLLGTTGFMAPEQALNSKNADHRSDLYGLGCTLFFMLTAREIYGGTTFVEKIVAHREQPVPKIAEHRDDTPAIVQAIFDRMVAKDQGDRYQSATELLSDVEKCLADFGHMWMIRRYLTEKKGRHGPIV